MKGDYVLRIYDADRAHTELRGLVTAGLTTVLTVPHLLRRQREGLRI